MEKRLTNETIIKTVSDDQYQIIKWIMQLYCPNGFDLDPTYSTGNFYKNSRVPRPKYRSDIFSQFPDVIVADYQALPFKPLSMNSIIFDPPFTGASRKDGKSGIIKKRFGYYKNIPELWRTYRNALIQFYMLLRRDGILVFKCQDSVESAKQYISHLQIMSDAVRIGFYPKDLFILTANQRLIGKTHHKQQHARKYHSYFWVFIKKKCWIPYFS